MDYPGPLQANATMELELSLGRVAVPLCRPRFTAYTDPTDINSFGNKDLLLVDGRPQFAEVAILRAFENEGWQGRWLETYPYRKNPRHWSEWKAGGPGAQEHVPIRVPWVNERLQAIAHANGGYYSGCWDVVAWKGGRLAFAESKKQKNDRMRSTQLRWLEAALQCGCSVDDFLVVEWSTT